VRFNPAVPRLPHPDRAAETIEHMVAAVIQAVAGTPPPTP
jgi:hypothetical protein